MRPKNVFLAAVAIFMLAVAVAPPALSADGDDQLTLDEIMAARGRYDRFLITLGGYISNYDSDLTVDPTGAGAGTQINLEQLLGLETQSNVFRLGGYWRINLKNRLAFGYYDVSRTGSGTVDEEFDFGDETITINSDVETTFDAPTFSLAYQYALVNSPKVESGVTIGFSFLDFETALQVTDNMAMTTRKVSASAVVPLLVAGYYGSVTLRPKWFFEYQMAFFTGSFGDYSGTVYDGSISSSYFPVKHFGFGAAYTNYGINVDVTESDFSGSIDYSNRGYNFFLIFCL